MSDEIEVSINGTIYAGWTDVRITRALNNCAGDFDLMVTERWAGSATPWQIAAFDKCIVSVGGDPVITGYVDQYMPSYDAETHTVRIAGRSKTSDLIDCMPDIAGGQFNGQTIDKIAPAVAAPFGITVLMQGTSGEALPDATLEKAETAYRFIERLARLSSLLICDDEQGNLLLTEAGTTNAAGALTEGVNILAAMATLSGNDRFSDYAVLGQAPLSWDNQEVQLAIKGTAKDPGVPRYRRHAEMSEAPADNALATKRAQWRAMYNIGRGTEARIMVQGWRQPNDALWQINQLVPVASPMLSLNRTLLVTRTEFLLDQLFGRRTELTLAPQEAFTPDPSSVKVRKRKGSSNSWDGVVPIQ